MTVLEIEQLVKSSSSYTIQNLRKRCMLSIAIDGLCLEFGVYAGNSLRELANLTDKEFYGFDSFEGLPDNWRPGAPKGTFALPTPPTFKNSRIHLVKGWFDQTIPPFMETHSNPLAFVHIDCDIYLSTKIIFDLLYSRFVSGTVILFDELLNYPEYADHEIKAFSEFLSTTPFTVECLGNTFNDGNREQAAFILR